MAAATGPDCHAGSAERSPVLLAMGHGTDRASSALRLTIGRWTTRDEIEDAAAAIAGSARSLLSHRGRRGLPDESPG